MSVDTEVRARSVIKSLRDVVLPALGEGDGLAKEQVQLSIQHIAMIEGLSDTEAEYQKLCLDYLADVAGRIVEGVSGGPRTSEAKSAVASVLAQADLRSAGLAQLRPSRLRSIRTALSESLSTLVHESAVDGKPESRTFLTGLLLEHGTRQADLDRSRYARAGLDPDAAALPEALSVLQGSA